MVHRRAAVGMPAFVAAIVVTAVVVVAAIFAAAPFSVTVTKTDSDITTTTATTTSTLTVTSTSLATPISLGPTETTTVTVVGTATTPAGGRLYEVTFRQSGACTPTVYAAPWSVTLGPWTVAEPSNATLPIATNSGSAGPSDVNYSSITFSVTNGQYQYSIAVGWSFGNPSGVITVNGGDVMVLLQGPEVSCTMTSTATG